MIIIITVPSTLLVLFALYLLLKGKDGAGGGGNGGGCLGVLGAGISGVLPLFIAVIIGNFFTENPEIWNTVKIVLVLVSITAISFFAFILIPKKYMILRIGIPVILILGATAYYTITDMSNKAFESNMAKYVSFSHDITSVSNINFALKNMGTDKTKYDFEGDSYEIAGTINTTRDSKGNVALFCISTVQKDGKVYSKPEDYLPVLISQLEHNQSDDKSRGRGYSYFYYFEILEITEGVYPKTFIALNLDKQIIRDKENKVVK